MGLFEKKFCDICGEKISLLGNRKLDDGNMCSSCAKLISPFMTDRRRTSVSDMKEHLAYRELNKNKLKSFNISQTIGDNQKVYIDTVNRNFIVTYHSPNAWDEQNPDVIPLSELCSCNLEIKENRQEEYTKDAQGNRQSYSPPRYTYDYDFYIHMTLSNRWFDEIDIKLNTFDVQGLNSQQYHNYEMQAQQIIYALTGNNANFTAGSGYNNGAGFMGNQNQGFGGMAAGFVNQIAYNAQNQQNGQYGQQPPQFGQNPQFGQQPPQFGQQPSQYGQNQQYGQNVQYAQNGQYAQNQQYGQQTTVQQNMGVQSAGEWFCTNCGAKNTGKFCANCGTPKA